MAESYEFDPAEWVSAGAVGQPGQRTFYLQARQGAEYVSFVVEKAQVEALARLAQELLSRSGRVVTPDDLDTSTQSLVEPIEPAWRIGSLSVGADEEGERFLLEGEELVTDDEEEGDVGVVRLWLDRDGLVALAAHAAYAVQAGARDTCRLCGRPIDPVTGHVCPATNGHGPLTA